MRITTSGNGELQAMIARLNRVARGEHEPLIAEAIAPVCQGLLDEQFAQGVNPAGDPWVQTQKGNSPPLTATKALARSAVAVADGRSVDLIVSDEKAIFHDGGTKTKDGHDAIPARPILPRDVLPPRYEEPIAEAGAKVLRDLLGGS